MIATFVAVAVVPLMAALRAYDDNTLTSWRWVFSFVDPLPVYLLVLAGAGLSFCLSRSDILERSPAATLPVLAFLAILPLWQEPEMVLDASRYFLQAKHLELYGVGSFVSGWGSQVAAWTDLPLVPFLYGLLFRAFGEARILIQGFTTLLFSLTVLLTFLAGKRLYDRDTGITAGLLLLGIPFLITQVPLMLVDVPAMFVVTLAIYTFLEALEQGGPARTVSASIVLVLAIFTKYSVPLMLLVLPVIALVRWRKGREAAWSRSAGVLIPAVGLGVVILLQNFEVMKGQLSLLFSYQLPGLGRWQESLFSTFFFQVHPVITLAACFGLIMAIRKRDLQFAIPAWFAVFVLFIQHERVRYIVPLLPLFTIMAARGLVEIKDIQVRRYIVYCVVATSLVIAAGAYVPFFKTESMANLQKAGRFLDGLEGSDAVLVLTLPQLTSTGNTEMAIPLLDLYTSKKIIAGPVNSFRPDERTLETSSLRFSWETPLPAFYRERTSGACIPVAVLSSRPLEGRFPYGPSGTAPLIPLAEFRSSSGVFRYKTFITVFKRNCLDETGQ